MLQRLRQINDFRDLRTKNNMIYLFTFKMKSPRQMMELSPQLTQLLYLWDVIKPLPENGGNDACLACMQQLQGRRAWYCPTGPVCLAPTFIRHPPPPGWEDRREITSPAACQTISNHIISSKWCQICCRYQGNKFWVRNPLTASEVGNPTL